MTRLLFLIVSLALVLTACATTPRFDKAGVNSALTPAQAIAEGKAVTGQRVLWGGVIVAGRNLKTTTQIEVLTYPLDRDDRPQIERDPQGRFVVEQDGYLETTEYAEGRLLTVLGALRGVREGRIGEADYRYPLLGAEQLYLWPKAARREPDTRFHFGIGVILH